MDPGKSISLQDAYEKLEFLSDRTPHTTPEQSAMAFATLAKYRDGAVFIGHYAGNSEWERHSNGDEFVMVVDGETTLVLLLDNEEVRHTLTENQFLVVPQGTWHRFETPTGVKIMTITPQPTDHSIDRPE